MYSMVTVVSNAITKRVDLKSYHHKKNFVPMYGMAMDVN